MSLADNIRRRRLELHLSQEYIADQLGVSRQAVSKWESGQSEPTAANLAELAALLELSLAELVGADEDADEDVSQPQGKQPNWILRSNLTNLALSMQAGLLHLCTYVPYKTVDGMRMVDNDLILFRMSCLLLCSIWMSSNLRWEEDLKQRRKNSYIELAYCCVQLVVAFFTLRFGLGLVGMLLTGCVLFFYIFYINPRYMNRGFTRAWLEKNGRI
ncbi:MAG: helix-turn-helix transcriptional regulator [Firmicutes bacterium]|nr:helix-turn-helix transcriptional regulator [Bacillota bacterium]